MSIRIPAQRPATGQAAAMAAAVPLAEPGWGRVLRVSAARACLTLVAALLAWSVLPLAVGWTPQVILSGSMEPRIHTGDVVVTKSIPEGALAKGQVVTVTDPDHPGRTRTHRVLRRDADGALILRGDANQAADSSPILARDVHGVGVLRVPYVGRPVFWLAERNWLALGATGLVLGWCVVTAFGGSRRSEDEPPADLPSESETTSSRPRVRRLVVAAAATAAAFGVATGPASAAFMQAMTNPVSTLAAASVFRPYQNAVTADTPNFFWRLDETSGTAVSDQTANNRHGTLVSTGSSWYQRGALASEPYSTAFSTSSTRINANTSVAGPSVFSVEAWIKTSSTTGGRVLGFGNATGTTDSTTTGRQLYLAPNGRAYFGVGKNETAVSSTSALNDNVWHHVVGTYTSGKDGMKLYVDGVLQDSTKATVQNLTGYWRAAGESMSGWPGNPTSTYYDGSLDELAVYTKVLTPARIQAHYDAATAP